MTTNIIGFIVVVTKGKLFDSLVDDGNSNFFQSKENAKIAIEVSQVEDAIYNYGEYEYKIVPMIETK